METVGKIAKINP